LSREVGSKREGFSMSLFHALCKGVNFSVSKW
jgi:hypothetical protein